jgi:hypothetical protein
MLSVKRASVAMNGDPTTDRYGFVGGAFMRTGQMKADFA